MTFSDNLPLSLMCAGFGLGVLALVASSLREARAMQRWPVARGRVLSSKVEEYRSDAGSGQFGGTRARTTLFRPLVSYEYEVAGKRYLGNRIAQSPGMNRGVPDFAEKIVSRYPDGSTVDVRFNPVRPEESVLEARVPKGWIVALAFALALLVLAIHVY